MAHDTLAETRSGLRRIAAEAAQLPGVRRLAAPVYRRMFQRPFQEEACYYGIYGSYAEAAAAAPATLPKSYDVNASGRMYHDRLDQVRVSDFPMIHWISRLLAQGSRSVFDLGGHIGISYYGFSRYIDYPPDMRWTVHDVHSVVVAGRDLAGRRDERGLLHFTDAREQVDGNDVMISCGALQYLEYTLAELLEPLRKRPAHVLINLTPMHRRLNYFTLQNIGFAICPYRVPAVPDFVSSMERLGYRLEDHWESHERNLRVPFSPEHDVECYHGFYFRLANDAMPARAREAAQAGAHGGSLPDEGLQATG